MKNYRAPTDEENRKVLDAKKNFNRLLNRISNVCSKTCFVNLRSDTLNDDENICVSNCQKKFFDVYDIGERLNNLVESGDIKVNLSSGKTLTNLVDQMTNKINI